MVYNTRMNSLLYGAGAVGLGLASCLLKNGERVDLVGRKETIAALQQHGLQRTGMFGDFQAAPDSFGAYTSLNQLPPTNYDFILVCTKSFDTRTSAEHIAGIPFLKNASTPIVLCQNGWGNAEIFAEQFPKSRINNGRVITGFRRPHKHQVDITVHADAIHLGSLFDDDVSTYTFGHCRPRRKRALNAPEPKLGTMNFTEGKSVAALWRSPGSE